ncbi:Zn-dependent exopeptidase [Dothidotthia symphoricarpi CBS 119687]|uniref:Zn-dependent exopeptidase n=1 Tax=Dothidotthia symphoricarpi CBS 119687 TaxID=1392245 RepID=A0A6A6AJI7_9PLEO|nr:Zn-dependent exopeptidase [Dothidotthia symphoricarpi CBS 119687]KAF2131074.1 Zn-dependent exopeptidase [Dothidotthia symphoricarpi CBS 119687]
MRASLLLLAAIGIEACQRERQLGDNFHTLLKRQSSNETFPPVLDSNEQILMSSFDNTSIATCTDVFLNYPVSNSLVLTYPNGTTFTPSLEEDVLEEDSTTSYPNRIPAFHGYSFTGNASAEYVYVGRGQQVDYQRLVALGVELEGKIALAKYGGPFRGLKIKNAQQHGMIGTVIFSDPGDDGNMTEVKGVAPYPEGGARNPTTIQRGSVQFLSTYPGDPTTPGYASKPDSPRADRSKTLPQIPSLPISWLGAQPILQALNGYGSSAAEINRTGWVGAIPGVNYSSGAGSGARLSLSNVMNDTYTTIWNSIGIINGTNQDEVVLVGNHRDAWIIGGAADPNSGSAVLMELAKAFSKLGETGWKPTRTIVLCSWDAEEYGLVGSTEWVEEYIPWLKNAAVSYLNVDVAVSGPIPEIVATPDLHAIGKSLMKKIVYPYRGTVDRTLFDVWSVEDGEVGVLGSGSDYTAFLHRGIASMDMGAGGGPNDPVYPYHSNYDSYHWMATFGDPGFHTHKAIGQYLTLLLYHFASDAVLPLEPAGYISELGTYLSDLEDTIASSNYTLDLTNLTDAISTFTTYANEFTDLRAQAVATNDAALLTIQNHKARDFSRGFTSQGGLPTREFYQNLITAPGRDTGYAPVTFPAITESITFDHDIELAKEWVGKTANAILVAANMLKT